MSVRDYQCWPDETGERAYLRHKCKDGYETMLLPKGRWRFDGQKVTPSVNCSDCGFHMFVEKTHDAEPEGERKLMIRNAYDWRKCAEAADRRADENARKLKDAAELRHELMGVVADVEQSPSGFDAICLMTIKRVMEKLGDIDAARNEEGKK